MPELTYHRATRAAMNVWSADPNCALHGLNMVAPLLDPAQEKEGEQHG
jgi:hypothetical protein